MTRNEAAHAVAEALNKADAKNAFEDPKQKSIKIRVGEKSAAYEFKSENAEARKKEVAHWRVHLVDELVSKAEHFKDEPAEKQAEAKKAPEAKA